MGTDPWNYLAIIGIAVVAGALVFFVTRYLGGTTAVVVPVVFAITAFAIHAIYFTCLGTTLAGFIAGLVLRRRALKKQGKQKIEPKDLM